MSVTSQTAPPVSILRKPWFWALALVLGLAWSWMSWGLAQRLAPKPMRLALVPAEEDPRARPVYQIPPFELVSQTGAAFGTKELEGQVWVASFFFTSCPSLCPTLMGRAIKLRQRLDEAKLPVQLVTFTVDPKTDTPEVLAGHADKIGASTESWTFLTGEPGKLESTVVDGFKQPMGTPGDGPDSEVAYDIAHGVRFILVDRALGVRGLYDTDDAGLARLVADAASVVSASLIE